MCICIYNRYGDKYEKEEKMFSENFCLKIPMQGTGSQGTAITMYIHYLLNL